MRKLFWLPAPPALFFFFLRPTSSAKVSEVKDGYDGGKMSSGDPASKAGMGKYRVVMVRHGDSEWNKHNRFCGWYDAPLSDRGVSEAESCGRAIKTAGFHRFDVAFTSFLTRPQQTLDKILEVIGQQKEEIEIRRSWRLNERHYGDLTGLNKAETAEKHGEEQVKIWRRAFDVPPPPITKDNPYYDSIMNDPRYKVEGGPSESEFPLHESLSDVIARFIPYWESDIVPAVRAGKRVLIVAHGSSLRSLVKHLEGLTPEQIMETNVPTGIPFVYDLDDDFKAVKERQYLGTKEEVESAIAKIKAQGKKKDN